MDSLCLLALELYNLNKYDDAIVYGEKCFEIAMNVNDAIVVGKVSLVLAEAYFSLEQFEKSLFYSKKAIEVCKECDKGEAYFVMGKALCKLKRFEEAINCAMQCNSIAQDSDDKNFIMKSLHLIANNKMNLQLYNDAIQYANKCIEAAKESGDRKVESRAQLITGRAYNGLCQYDTALSYLTEGLEIAEQLADDDSVKEFKISLSDIHFTVGIKGLELSEIREWIKNSENVGEPFELLDVALKFESQGEYGRALSVYEKVSKKLVELKVPEYRIKMKTARMNCLLGNHNIALRLYHEILCYSKGLDDKLFECECHYSMGKVFVIRGALKTAENCVREAIKCFETMFHFLGKNDKFKIAFVDKYIRYYETLTCFLLMTMRYKEALVNLDCYRARALKSQLIMNYGMKQDLHEESRIQFTEIESLISNNNYTIVQYFACEYMNSLLVFLLERGSDLIVVEQSLQNCSDFLEKCVENAFTEMNVRHVTCENRCLNVGEENTDDKKVQSEDTGIEEKLEILLNRTGDKSLEFRSPENKQPSENVDGSSLSALEILYSKLLRNVMPLIKQEEIVFLPDGPLFKIPFAALRDPGTGRYLSEMKRIRIAPSISTLKILNDRPSDFYSKRGALIIGDPLVGKVMYDGQEREFKPLLNAYIEALAISTLFHVELFSREKATKAAVLEKLHQGVSVVHIAAHGDVQKATILLAPSPEVRATKIPDEEDYVLTMDDVQNCQVRAKLVVLSCCQSGRGEIRAEGVVGMCRAFLAAGAGAVVASLWSIDDDATREFMKEFYLNLREKKSATLSLQLAMEHMRGKEEYNQPKYWAPFFLMGDDVTIDF
ncbi:hypothetical protein QZH41_007885 [Actinostola sp. cb2023]|nr:hypothetical protein QZH41_007885 [Actinostola sp. cb2023]